MLDTNIVSYAIRNKPLKVRTAFKLYHGHMCISSITFMELIYGAEKHPTPEKMYSVVETMIARLDVLHFENEAAIHTGQIRAELSKLGTPIGPYDQMIAGHARSKGLILVTHNTKDFDRVSGLRLDNWA